jgi:predicted transcriptional regulator
MVYLSKLKYMSGSTTIKVNSDLKDVLSDLRLNPRESYNDVITRLVDMACDDDELSDEAIRGLELALEDIKAGRVHSEESILKEFGLL